ncbi:helix-turn-helix domain-containing protein [Propionibacterium australiense]|uniref:HTH_XRE n=1 Tax=Propionibacterium australiense TaxID=119981 RepID=A0A383S4A0_9ACTN|nr:helix-turn-helix transcriptional regulator [Propionibacterium australiense]RLP10627.1 helix-turn-helix domain-containing protein [Propionibacterium australiense]RLP12922.1 helix-turn-helix domain-containing protein [Propionibacterium australiense]SYZ32830.1 HTH_XRE [Propionibacterium australiense]VEH91159.1 anaerobic benzoate catabolism transcriptional regulator [Propionibacterium australiense]
MKPLLVRELLGEALREHRMGQGRTLRDVSLSARVSLGYLSEVERGQKEASSELLFSICEALHVPMSEIFRRVSEKLLVAEIENGEDLGAQRNRQVPAAL